MGERERRECGRERRKLGRKECGRDEGVWEKRWGVRGSVSRVTGVEVATVQSKVLYSTLFQHNV